MAQIRNFTEAHEALQAFYGSTGQKRYTLGRIRALLKFLGNPQDDLHIIHVAGTSGKTSTAYYAAALLKAAGCTVGLTVSPHVDEINERLQINLTPLPEDEFCKALSDFLTLVDQSGIKPSYFELMIALAFYEFRRRQVDYAVVEVGLGGLLDATNVVSHEDKVCVITDIGLDHTEVLGKTLAAITGQKAGIIQQRNHVFIFDQSPEVMNVVREVADVKNAKLHQALAVSPPETKSLPLFQQRNFELALSSVSFVLSRDQHPPLTSRQIQAAVHTYIPARMEVIKMDGQTLIIDGAHNAQKIEELLKSIKAWFGDRRTTALVAFVSGHDSRWQGTLDILLAEVSELIITSYAATQDTPKTGTNPEAVASYCAKRQFTDYIVEPSPQKAYQLLKAASSPLKLVTGSFYLLNDIRPLIRREITHK